MVSALFQFCLKSPGDLLPACPWKSPICEDNTGVVNVKKHYREKLCTKTYKPITKNMVWGRGWGLVCLQICIQIYLPNSWCSIGHLSLVSIARIHLWFKCDFMTQKYWREGRASSVRFLFTSSANGSDIMPFKLCWHKVYCWELASLIS